jgi:hypothetical protein
MQKEQQIVREYDVGAFDFEDRKRFAAIRAAAKRLEALRFELNAALAIESVSVDLDEIFRLGEQVSQLGSRIACEAKNLAGQAQALAS